jgi:hypothetical protein
MSHKIFDRHLSINLVELTEYLDFKHDEILSNTMKEENYITDLMVKRYTREHNLPSKLNKKYNVFKFDNSLIKEFYDGVKDCFMEVCEFYNIDFNDQNYMIRGWFNYDKTSKNGFSVDPRTNPRYFHDHLGGHGVPDFHGYYCVNAEPSKTFYKMKDDSIYENENKNNRLVICSNGFPHGRDDWYFDSPRITIAYDIVPFSRLVAEQVDSNSNWLKFS